LSYLRFTPDDYRLLARACRHVQLGGCSRAAFNRLLVESLSSSSPGLAQRIACLRRTELSLLYDHFRERLRPTAEGDRQGSDVDGGEQGFTPGELRVIAEACLSAPFHVRFVRPFKRVLVELFQEAWPALAQKLARLSGSQFERLYEHACGQRRGSA
jgi:hypothetical protein